MVWPKPKELLACMMFAAFCGIMLAVANTYIGDLATHEQASTWPWFWGLWALTAVIGVLAILPQWLSNTLLTHDPVEKEKQRRFWKRFPAYMAMIMVIGGSLTFTDMTIYIIGCAVSGGLLTAALIMGIGLVATKKGRAMREPPAARGKRPSRSR